jgi:protein gp37
MGEVTRIGWTDHTFNPWRGCARVSPGCYKCYAEALSRRNPATLGVWGVRGTRVVAAESMWREPLKWDRQAKAAGVRRRVFCASLADVFEDWQGPMIDAEGRVLHYNSAATWWTSGANPHGPITMGFVRERLFGLIERTPNLDWLLLTKRPGLWRSCWPLDPVPGHVRQNEGDGKDWRKIPNLWLGVSAEDQARADERIPILLGIPAAVRWVSAEPLLGPIALDCLIYDRCPHCLDAVQCPETGAYDCRQCDSTGLGDEPAIDWVVAGGESGPNRRPMDVAWIASIVDQCKAAGVACYVKQASAFKDGSQGDIPDELWRIKEFPQPDPIGA